MSPPRRADMSLYVNRVILAMDHYSGHPRLTHTILYLGHSPLNGLTEYSLFSVTILFASRTTSLSALYPWLYRLLSRYRCLLKLIPIPNRTLIEVHYSTPKGIAILINAITIPDFQPTGLG